MEQKIGRRFLNRVSHDVSDRVCSNSESSATEKGATLVEYTLLITLVAVTAIGALYFLGAQVSSVFVSLGDEVGDNDADLGSPA